MAMLADAWDMHGDVGTGGWILMALAMVLFWGALIAFVVWLVRGAATGAGWGSARPAEDPKAILERRLASGDITPEDYEQRRRILDGGAAPSG